MGKLVSNTAGLALALMASTGVAGTASAAEVFVVIDGIAVGKGIVNVAFCDHGPLDQCKQYGGEQPANAETLGFRFENVPPGKYAVVGYQDFDNRTMYGMLLLLLILVMIVNGILSHWEKRLHHRFGRQ